MLRNSTLRLAPLAAAAWLLLAPTHAEAQKALVYCPVGLDATGCNTIVAALTADVTLFPDGVDPGYDGTSGTADLAGIDLSAYAAFVVPSLADGPDVQPYALLRNATIAGRIREAFVGRTAVWSGTPDRGSTNRGPKDELIRNLVRWARADAGGTHGPGLVALQDNSDDAVSRYGWMPGISALTLAPDTTLDVYGNVQVLTTTGQTLLMSSSGLQIGYSNMASYGLVRPAGSTANDDATGGRSARVVLVTLAGEPGTSVTATVRTDREDYGPGDTVEVSGAGWDPGETVDLLFREEVEPLIHPDVTLSTTADPSGLILDRQFVADSEDSGIRFTLTATGRSSGRTAQTTFTDGNRLAYTTAPFTSARNACSPTITVQLQQGSNPELGHPTVVTLSTSSGGGSFHTASNCNNGSTVSSVTIPTSSSTVNFFYKDGTPGTPTLTAVAAASSCNGGNCTVTQIETITTTTTTNLSSSSQPSVFGQAVTFTAVVAASAGTPPAGSTVTFKEGAATLGTGTLNGVGQATFSTSTLGTGGHSITATYDGTPAFLTSTSSALTQTVNKASTSTAITADTPDPSNVGQAAAVSYTVTVSAPGAGTPTGNVTVSDGVNSCTGTVAAGTCSVSLSTSGSRTLTATYGGDGNFNGSTSAGASHQVTSPAVATALTVATASGSFGGTAALSATLTASGNPVSGKSIAFTLNGTSAGTATTNATGTASIAAASLGTIAVGNYPSGVGASFAGDASFLTSSGSNALTVTAGTATVALSNLSRAYDGTPKAATVTTTPSGLAVSVTYDGTAAAPTNAGSYSVVATVTNPNYTGSASGTLVISPITLTGHFTAANKEYDGGIAATITGRSLTGGIVGSDQVSLTGGTATFADKHVGTGKTVTGNGFSLTGTGAGNYALSSTTATTTANITALAITVTAATDSREYDGTDHSSGEPAVSGGPIQDGDAATFTQAFDNKNVGTGKTLTPAGAVNDGNGGQNYSITFVPVTTGVITPKELIGTITVANKPYDGNTSATITDRSLSGTIGTDDVSYVGGTASFDNRNAGIGKTVNASGLGLDGAGQGNYTVNTTASTTANIDQLPITVTAVSDTKTYDGTTTSDGIPAVSGNSIIAPDLANFTQAFDNKNAGSGKTLNPAGAVNDGNGGNNYDVHFVSASTGKIERRGLTVSATVTPKTYDGNTDAVVTLSDDRVTDDVLTLDYSHPAHFDTKNAGSGKTVAVNGITVGGADAGNYTANTTATATGTILRRKITVTAATDTREYNGNTGSTGVPTITYGTLVSGETATWTQAFDSKHAGSRTLTPAGSVADGNGGLNYDVTFQTANGSISTRGLTPSATGQNKMYDATDAATVTLGDDRLAGDSFTLDYSHPAHFDNKNVGTGKAVSVSGIVIVAASGPEAGDYHLTLTTATTTANVGKAPLVVSATGINKIFDGNTSASATLSATPLLSDIVAPLSYANASFATPSAGLNKPITVTGISLGGADAGNYAYNTTAATTANITYFTGSGHMFLQPVNLPPQQRSAFKINSTIPVKFQIFLADGVTPVPGVIASISTLKVSSTAPDGVNEDVVSTVPDQGTSFRYDPTGKLYIFNLGTKAWSTGTYRIIATLDDGSTITADVEARSK